MTGPTLGHSDRPVTFTEWKGRPAIEKRYLNGGAPMAWDVMRDLWASPFGVGRNVPGLPEPLDGDEDRVIMERLVGEPAGARGELGQTVAIAPAAARLVADLHESRVVVPRRRTGRRLIRALERKRDDLHHASLRELFAETFELLDPRILDGELVINHGDFSPRNVMLSVDGPRLIDFDRCQMAPRARDVTYWGAWVWATQVLAGQPASWDVADTFEATYADACALPTFDHRHRNAHRAAALLRIAHGWSAFQTQPEVARRVVTEAHDQLSAFGPR